MTQLEGWAVDVSPAALSQPSMATFSVLPRLQGLACGCLVRPRAPARRFVASLAPRRCRCREHALRHARGDLEVAGQARGGRTGALRDCVAQPRRRIRRRGATDARRATVEETPAAAAGDVGGSAACRLTPGSSGCAPVKIRTIAPSRALLRHSPRTEARGPARACSARRIERRVVHKVIARSSSPVSTLRFRDREAGHSGLRRIHEQAPCRVERLPCPSIGSTIHE